MTKSDKATGVNFSLETIWGSSVKRQFTRSKSTVVDRSDTCARLGNTLAARPLVWLRHRHGLAFEYVTRAWTLPAVSAGNVLHFSRSNMALFSASLSLSDLSTRASMTCAFDCGRMPRTFLP